MANAHRITGSLRIVQAAHDACWSRQPRIAEAVEAIRRVEQTGAAYLATSLLPFVWPFQRFKHSMFGRASWAREGRTAPAAVRAAALSAIDRLVLGASAAAWAECDELIRTRRFAGLYGRSEGGRPQMSAEIGPETLVIMATPEPSDIPPGEGQVALLAILASAPSGYLREAAVEALSTVDEETAFRYLLWRTTDWVDVVRNKAAAWTFARLPAMSSEALTALTPDLERLRARGRSFPNILEEVEAETLLRGGWPLLLADLASPNRERGRAAAALVSRHEDAPFESATPYALISPDPVVRSRLFDWAERLGPDVLKSLLEQLSQDPSPTLRVRALQALAQDLDADATVRLRMALFDPASKVAELARFWVGRFDPEFDLVALYRRLVQEPGPANQSASAILGLAEVGDGSDAAMLRALRPTSVKGRSARLRALQALDPKGVEADLWEGLSDSAGVVRTALALLPGRLADQDLPRFEAAWQQATASVRRQLARGALRLPTWVALQFLLERASDPWAAKALASWPPRSSRGLYRQEPAPAERQVMLLKHLSEAKGLTSERQRIAHIVVNGN